MTRRTACALALSVLALAACEREQRTFRTPQRMARPDGVLQPADWRAGHYDENAYAMSQGKQWFTWYNCNGCHGQGGGGSGPALMDTTWRYGSAPEQIFSTIVEGRPNGMPSFRGRIPDYQVWQLVAYVRSMSGLVRKDAAPGRNDGLDGKPPEQMETFEDAQRRSDHRALQKPPDHPRDKS